MFKVYFEDGIGAYTGQVLETKQHTHHVTELIFSLQGPFKVANALGISNEYQLVLIPSDVAHSYIGALHTDPIFIYLDPFHNLSVKLVSQFNLGRELICLDHLYTNKIIDFFQDWIKQEQFDIKSAIINMVDHLTGTTSSKPNHDDRILTSLEYIRNSLGGEVRLEDIASQVHLSESRYAHLFKDQVGIPFRRFVLWTRLQTTITSIIRGHSLTRACYEGGFSDLPHFSKTFTDMFGVSPSSVLKG